MELPKDGIIEAFAIIVDINGFTPMVSRSHRGEGIAQFVKDVLLGGIDEVQKQDGTIVSFMGDAFLAIMDKPEAVYLSCARIAKTLDEQCEYISLHQENYPDGWHYSKGGPSLKISIEFGWLDISTIHSELLGEQRLLIGPPINYASRISSGGEGNRCLVGPEAMKKGMDQWINHGPYAIEGKAGEGIYNYWEMDLGCIWREGQVDSGGETFWG